MDLNPYKFEAPWNAWEFAYHVLHREANLVILSMAWLTLDEPRPYSRFPNEPDMQTLSYWLSRLEPIIRDESVGEIIVVFANRTGSEDEVLYAGTSAVLGIDAGEVKVYGILGRGERELLIVDTSLSPKARLISGSDLVTLHDTESVTISASSTTSTSTSTFSEMSDMTVDTPVTACTPPATDDMQFPTDVVAAPITRVGPNPSGSFSANTECISESQPRADIVRSTTDFKDLHGPETNIPNLDRPASPKSRNTSRTRQPAQHGRVSVSRVLAQEQQLIGTSLEARPPEQSATAAPDHYQSHLISRLSPKSEHASVRPKSTLW